jgi:hypothetical protein
MTNDSLNDALAAIRTKFKDPTSASVFLKPEDFGATTDEVLHAVKKLGLEPKVEERGGGVGVVVYRSYRS